MMELFQSLGYVGVFLASIFDHSGTPAGVMVSMSLVTSGYLSFFPTMLLSVLGGVAGDLALFLVGWYGGKPLLRQIKKKKPKTKEPLEKAEAMFRQYGAVGIIFGRFIALVGRYFTLVYGALQFSPWVVLLYSVLGNVLMMLLFGLPIYFFGERVNQYLDSPFATLYLTVGVLVIQFAVSIFYYLKKHHGSSRIGA
jgi:membrane protein DedA with SNARE-associated domain